MGEHIVPEAFKNITDYAWESFEPFSVRRLSRVDSLILSQLSYLRLPQEAASAWQWGGLPLYELWRATWLDDMTERMYDPQGAVRLLEALVASPRFREVRVFAYTMQEDQQREMQFSAMSFAILPNQTYVAYRGTDNTVLGWKENFNMAFQVQLPSQMEARRYLEDVAGHTTGTLFCGGHSKGGTLAQYAAMSCEGQVRERISCCFLHDSPGITSAMLADLGQQDNTPPLDRTIPKSSLMGMLFAQENQDALVVRSASSGVAQHDPLSWEVKGNDFVYEEHIGRTANYVDKSLNAWIEQASLEERERFVEALFSVFKAGDEPFFHDLKVNWREAWPKMVRAAVDLEPEQRELLMRQFANLIRELAPGGE